jgi:hypothetical protein
MPESLFRRVTRYPQSPSLNPRENRLTEVTAAVLERVDGLAQAVVCALLASAGGASSNDAQPTDAPSSAYVAEIASRERALKAAEALIDPRASIRTQLTTPKGRFVDLEIWLQPRRPSERADDIRVWIEAKHGTDVHGDQLEVYLADIQAYPASHRVVMLLIPRDQELAALPPDSVPLTTWQTISEVVQKWRRERVCRVEQKWLLDEYASYLYEEGLMDPEALDAAYVLALMEANDAEAAAASICEHADAWVMKHWGARTGFVTRRGASTEPDYGLGYWANYSPDPTSSVAADTWRGGWFEWGMRNTEDMEYVDAPRGSYAFYAGASFEAKSNPYKTSDNEAWMNARLADGFVRAWFTRYRMVRLKYPDELLAYTTLEDQGQALGQWVVEAFHVLAANAPPH